MAVDSGNETLRVFITGANTGLGLATCKRIIDEFLVFRPSSQHLHLLITTRSSKKSSETVSTLQTYAHRNPETKAQASSRLSFSAYQLDLCNIPQIKTAVRKISSEHAHIDVLICNAGIAGWVGLNWFQAVRDVLLKPIQATTWPEFNIGSLNLRTAPQNPDAKTPEPPLGQVFCANVFGHYILVHLLAPLLATDTKPAGVKSRIIWVSSVATLNTSLDLNDIQCLDTRKGYDSSKRLTDLLALTSTLSGTESAVASFYDRLPATALCPEMYIAQPGVMSTNIMPIPWILIRAKELSFYMARWMGSPWHVVTPYKGAVSSAWLALAPQATVDGMEALDGKAKWGSATNWWGKERVRRTEVEGWGFGGKVGAEAKFGRTARRAGTVDLTEEEKERFVEMGREAWGRMEKLRKEWLERLKGVGE